MLLQDEVILSHLDHKIIPGADFFLRENLDNQSAFILALGLFQKLLPNGQHWVHVVVGVVRWEIIHVIV